MSRADGALRHAADLQQRLKEEGRYRDAEIVRAICHSYRMVRETASRLHADNRDLREGKKA